MAVDAAASIQAKNSLERMLAHQLAVAHRLGMHMAEQSERLVDRHETWGKINQAQSVEACRLANAAARMMGAFQDGSLALDKIRRGGKQTVKVVHQHVAVGPGGQAVVAGGNVKGAGGVSAGGRYANDQYTPNSAASWARLAEEWQQDRQPRQCPEMRRKDPQGHSLQVGGHAERAMPDARRP